MTREDMIAKANVIRSRDVFGAMTPEELAALPGTQKELRVEIPDGRAVRVYEVRPDAIPDGPAPLIVNYHGGGFIKGRGDRDWRYCAFLADALKCVVWDVDYCLAPEHPFPQPLEDCYGVAAYAFANAATLGFDNQRIALAGHSAGGALAFGVMEKAAANGAFMPRCLLMEYFPADQSVDPVSRLTPELAADPWWLRRAETEREYTLFYCTAKDAEDPLCSPLKADAALLARFPASLIISAGKDTLQKDTEAAALRLAGSGAVVTLSRVPEAMHGFTTNRTEGWERALALHEKFFRDNLL